MNGTLYLTSCLHYLTTSSEAGRLHPKENSDDDADEVNMQDFIHNASQLYVV